MTTTHKPIEDVLRELPLEEKRVLQFLLTRDGRAATLADVAWSCGLDVDTAEQILRDLDDLVEPSTLYQVKSSAIVPRTLVGEVESCHQRAITIVAGQEVYTAKLDRAKSLLPPSGASLKKGTKIEFQVLFGEVLNFEVLATVPARDALASPR